MTTALIEFKEFNLNLKQGKSQKQVLSNIDLTIESGDCYALIGESGSGKSMLAQQILQLTEPSLIAEVSGQLSFGEQDMFSLQEAKLRSVRGNDIGFIFQEPLTALNPLHNISKQLRETIELHQDSKDDDDKQIYDLLEKVGLDQHEHILNAYPHQLSGGQRQRVMIAMAIANQPKLLIADEPTTALDVTLQKQILDLISQLQQDLGMTVLLISHDLNIIKRYANKISVMYQGEIVETAHTEQIFRSPKAEFTQTLLAAEPKGTAVSLPQNPRNLIETKSLNVWYPIQKGIFKRTVGHIKAANDICLKLKTGQTIGIVGESGSGKSSLGQALVKLIESKGTINYKHLNLNSISKGKLKSLRKSIQIVFQDPFASLSPRMSIYDIISEGADIHYDLSDEEKLHMVNQILQQVGLDPNDKYKYPHEFSGGQRQRIAIARSLILNPDLIVLDEPTSALDRHHQSQLLELLKELQSKEQIAFIFITHDLKVIQSIAHELIVMKDGQMIEHGTCREVIQSPKHPYTQSLMSAAFDH